jgi:hypothetical protein
MLSALMVYMVDDPVSGKVLCHVNGNKLNNQLYFLCIHYKLEVNTLLAFIFCSSCSSGEPPAEELLITATRSFQYGINKSVNQVQLVI